MPDTIFYRELIQGTYNSVIKGVYHEDSERPISEECFGDWIDTELGLLKPIGKKLRDDFWSIGLKDAQFTANTLIDIHFKNFDACKF